MFVLGRVSGGENPDPDVEALHRGGFRCRLCQITAANRPSLQSHLAGRRHRRLRCLRAERRSQEQRSLFVSGFPRGTDPARLRQHFRAFGHVATVVMDKEKGAFAIVELRDPAGRQRALDEPRHSWGGRRLRVRPREGPPPLPPGLLQALGQAQDVGAQLQLLVRALELSAAERRLRHLLVTLIQEVFTEFFPGCSVVPYGSSVNGFDVHGCDLDLHLELGDPQSPEPPNGDPQSPGAPKQGPPEPRDPERGPPEVPFRVRGVPFGVRGLPFGGRRPLPRGLPVRARLPGSRGVPPGPRGAPGAAAGAGGRGCCGAACRGSAGVRALPAARRPVVKFSHKQSGLAGDVCLDNRLALINTRFLRLCADADPRVRPLGYALRLWAGRQRLAGNRAGGGPLLTNYALTLLLVLFLQSRSPPVLPSLRRLQQLAGPQDRARVGGWDCSFPRDAAELEPSGNTQSAASLLAEFFSYFGTLDLGGLLLSPLEGRALPRPPPETLGGLRPGPLTLQDPFELNHNVAANVTARTVSRFARCCRDAARLCRGPEFLQKSRRGRPWGVLRLLQAGPGGNPGNSQGEFLIAIPGAAPQRQVCAAVRFVLGEVLGCGCEPEGTAGTAARPPPGARGHLDEGTGDSRGEFGTPGDEEDEGRMLLDPSEPPPGARGHLEEGTGGSRGELGTPGDEEDEGRMLLDPSEPPPGAECHLEERTGDSRGELGTPGDEGKPPAAARCHLEEVTGHSRGELGTPGDEGKPPAAARCHLEEVTGHSRGELGTLGTPGDEGKPPAAARCHLEEVTGHSRGELGTPARSESPEQALVDPPGSEPGSPCHLGRAAGDSPGGSGAAGTPGKRRLPEGVPAGAGVPPAKRPRPPPVPSRWSCCVWYRVWRGRRRLRRRLRPRGGSGGAEGSRGGQGLGGPGGPGGARGPGGLEGPGGPGGLQDLGGLSAHPGGSRRDPQMLLRLRPEPDPPSPLFQEFFHFLRSFLPGMVRLRLGGGAETPAGGGCVQPGVLQ
ncbi:LOW QUALITY PROTEIN: speckle targeted PIP5K1A-regulated poly(A) polymerase [Chamaea fasciata]|uniref:LOW QUALITY PROTEIN: speckle targeted PIP5K1A-regulated poly(A) polymerase n=1 Tax=Chamaea fasciata TaxID=190680 RepID=UPI00336AD419